MNRSFKSFFEPVNWIYYQSGISLRKLMVSFFIQCLVSFLGISYALIFRVLVDSAATSNLDKISLYSCVFILILVFQVVLNAFLRRFQEKAIIMIENNLKKECMNEIMYREYGGVVSFHSGEWMNKITSDIPIVAKHFVHIPSNIGGIAVQIISALIFLMIIEPRYLKTVVICLTGIILFESVFYKRIKFFHKEVQEKDGSLRVYIQEMISSLIVIKAYRNENTVNENLNTYLDEYRDSRLRMNLFSVIMNMLFGLGTNGALILSAIYCSYCIYKGTMTYGSFVAIIQIISQLRSPIANAYVNIPNYYAMVGSVERLREIEKWPLENTAENKEITEERREFKSIVFSDVGFEYTDEREHRHVIEGLSFCMNKDDFTVITGPSGCGKSTLLKLLLSLYKPSKGDIKIETVNGFHDLDISWRDLFAYVPQDNQLMKGTIRDVICFGETYDEQKMKKAIKVSCCDEFMDSLENGIMTQLLEKGSGLSEGQMQRISIARAVYSEKPVLLLDEATSALNEEIEQQLINRLVNETDRTIVLVTHHRKIAQYADMLLKCRETEGEYFWETERN